MSKREKEVFLYYIEGIEKDILDKLNDNLNLFFCVDLIIIS